MEIRYRSKLLLILLMLFILGSCIEGSSRGRRTSARTDFLNNPASLSLGHSRVILTNPVVQSGDAALPTNSDLSQFITPDQYFITNSPFLFRECRLEDPINPGSEVAISPCMRVFQRQNTAPTPLVSGTWGFEPNTPEFLEVNTFFHVSRGIDKILDSLDYSYAQGWLNPTINYNTAIPSSLVSTGSFWFSNKVLDVFSSCDEFANATFDPTTFSICFGIDPDNEGLVFSQDPSVIYHELGHAFVKVVMNSRNSAAGLDPVSSSDLGAYVYDEPGSINEGIADYFSYVFGNRTRMGEWALNLLSRPVSEADGGHAPGIDTTFEGRLSYPDFVNYNSTNTTATFEDIHFTGQIASHFFVALTESFKNDCGQSHEIATRNMIYLLAETMSEVGDLTSRGLDSNPIGENYVNLQQVTSDNKDPFLSYRWAHTINPPNFRRFFQVFSKYFLDIFVDHNNCNNAAYPKDNYEQLLDAYGLLLFDTYNEDGNGQNGVIASGHLGTVNSTITKIEPINRQKTVRVSKEQITFDPDSEVDAFIFDTRTDLVGVVGALRFAGRAVTFSDEIPNDLGFNNGNGQISPGELVGISLNLFNDSNSEMGGVQILGNDWDHGKINPLTNEIEPCNTFADNFPLATEGAADLADETGGNIPSEGDCQYITRENGGTVDANGVATEPLAPVCWVQLRDENETKWVSQNVFRKSMNLNSSKCLYQNGNFNNCLISVVNGADSSYFSRISPQNTWAQTIAPDGEVNYTLANLILFEVNKFIPPGTKFDCRFRARLSNCNDCYEDPDSDRNDYLDFEYSGAEPFKIIHLQFEVND